jgi:hypothetical protein
MLSADKNAKKRGKHKAGNKYHSHNINGKGHLIGSLSANSRRKGMGTRMLSLMRLKTMHIQKGTSGLDTRTLL